MKLAQNGLDFKVRKNFKGIKLKNLFELSVRATKHEMLLWEEQQRKNSALGTHYQDLDGEMEIDVTQIIGKYPIVCATLKRIEDPINMPSNHPFKKDTSSTYQ